MNKSISDLNLLFLVLPLFTVPVDRSNAQQTNNKISTVKSSGQAAVNAEISIGYTSRNDACKFNDGYGSINGIDQPVFR